jgi:hypothetical protein
MAMPRLVATLERFLVAAGLQLDLAAVWHPRYGSI